MKHIYCYDSMNKQYFIIYYEADANLDGIIDEKDKNTDGISVESGHKTDLPIAHKETIVDQNGNEIVKYDYSSYFNTKNLNKMMNDWFAKQEE